MKLMILGMVMILAAMGPAREGTVPAIPPRSPEERPVVVAPVAVEPVIGVTRPGDGALTLNPADQVSPGDFLWTARPVVVFADTPEDPAFRQQIRVLRARPDMLSDRDVVVIVDTDPDGTSVWRQQLHPRGFSLVIIDKDGQVKMRKPFPWDVREISRSIDKFPLRLQETGRSDLGE